MCIKFGGTCELRKLRAGLRGSYGWGRSEVDAKNELADSQLRGASIENLTPSPKPLLNRLMKGTTIYKPNDVPLTALHMSNGQFSTYIFPKEMSDCNPYHLV